MIHNSLLSLSLSFSNSPSLFLSYWWWWWWWSHPTTRRWRSSGGRGYSGSNTTVRPGFASVCVAFTTSTATTKIKSQIIMVQVWDLVFCLMDLKLLSKGSVLVLSGSNPPDCPIVLVPAKVVQALNFNFDNKNGQVQPRFYTWSVWIIFSVWMILWVLDFQCPKIQWNFINYVGSILMILCIFWVCKCGFSGFSGVFFWVWWQVQILSLINC